MEFSIFTIFKCPGWWHYGHSHCCETIASAHLQNLSIFLGGSSVGIRYLPLLPTPRLTLLSAFVHFRFNMQMLQLVNCLNPMVCISSCIFRLSVVSVCGL